MHKTAQEAIDAFTLEHGDDIMDFDGMNCNDYLSDGQEECLGWQIGDRRCDCGNRRVSIETYGDANTGFVAFACAY